ncbi:MAG: hypothetical protein KGI80_02010 [Verrucomicrobiota bacterium]|nr:hypothetical protein [Verrucomicrobiota bacterium]
MVVKKFLFFEWLLAKERVVLKSRKPAQKICKKFRGKINERDAHDEKNDDERVQSLIRCTWIDQT